MFLHRFGAMLVMLLALAHAAQAQTASPHPGQHAGYARLLRAFGEYKAIAQRSGWPYVPAGRLLEFGVEDERIETLRRRLLVEGDLPASAAQGRRFDQALELAVRRFQARHGLSVDGRVGPRTLRALNRTVEQRIGQIVVNLKRWHDIPADLPARRLEINIPAAELLLYERNEPVGGMRVVIGTNRNRTPLLESQVEAVVFNPPWNVPRSITYNEILPRLRREPGYLREHDIRILERPFDPYGEQIDWSSPERAGVVTLRQEPGPNNALGRIKFDIPNAYSVYLHDTPDKSVFGLDRRALSHGCIRLQYPEHLARYILRDHLRLDPDLITRVLSSTETVMVPVNDPLPVMTLYFTAFVAPDGTVQFRDDVYGRDGQAIELDYPGLPAPTNHLAAAPSGECNDKARAG